MQHIKKAKHLSMLHENPKTYLINLNIMITSAKKNDDLNQK